MKQSTQDWRAVKRIVANVLDAAVEERAETIARLVNGDEALKAEVESLVRAAEGSPGLLSPALDSWVGAGRPELGGLAGQRVGRYVLDGLIAEGSTSAVYSARQLSPERTVAIKVLRDPLPLIDGSGRFDREAVALGRIDHPNVARIFEAGIHRTETNRPLPFIAMEWVAGTTITEHVRTKRLVHDDIVRLAIKVASAVHAAHQKAIIHRDLKPANVLVTPEGEPKVLDFGIARLLDGGEQTWLTTAGMLLGTPGYMSPEQAAGRLDEVDVRTDVWALGVLFYEMLTGRLPIDVSGVPIVEVIRRISSMEPTPIGRVDSTLHGDLSIVIMTALSREKSRRYPSAQALADDLARILRHEPISARAPSATYRMAKFARRHRTGVTIAVLFSAILVVATGLLTRSYFAIRLERNRAQAISNLLGELILAGDPNYGDRNVKMVDVLHTAEDRLNASVGPQPEVEAQVRSALGWMYFGLGEYERADANLTRAIALRRSYAPADAAEILSDQNRLATVLRWEAKPDEARAMAEQALADARRTLGDAHKITLTAMEVIAGCYHDKQDLVVAETRYREAIEAASRSLGATHEVTLTMKSNLANVLGDAGKYEEAEQIQRSVLAARRAKGQHHTLSVLTQRHNLANTLSELGRAEEALAELESVAHDAAEALGPDHEHTLGYLSSLAESLQRQGRTDRALAISRDVLERRIALNGWSNEFTHKACNDYLSSLLRARHFEEAHEIGMRAVAEAERAFGRDQLIFHRQQMHLAAALSGLGRHAEAQALYLKSLEFLKATFGEDHRQTLIASNNLGLCYVESGDGSAAIGILEPALARVQANTLVSMEPVLRRNLGRAYHRAKRFDDAELQLTTAWNLSTSRGESENAFKCATALASLYDELGRSDDATAWRLRAEPPR